MPRLGLIGHPVGHSLSPQLFADIFRQEGIDDGSYRLFDIPPQQLTADSLRELIARERLDGLNVTVPHKEAVIPLLDCVSDKARQIGAVNVITINSRGTLTGHNTDAAAFRDTLLSSCFWKSGINFALILGTGGAAKAVAYALKSLGIDYRFVSRSPQSPAAISYAEAYAMVEKNATQLIVNATPLGMHPNIDETAWKKPELLTPRHLCYDLVYAPSPTRFLAEAAAAGSATIDGMAMLQRQALLGWQLFNYES